MSSRDELIYEAWSRGILSYKVRDHQEILWSKIQEIVQNPSFEPYVVNCSRRFGKSTLGMLALIEESLKYPGTSYLFCAPTEGHAKEIIRDVTTVLIDDSPADFKPIFKNGRYTFPNGSEVRIGGAYDGGESLRGRSAHGAIVDEAAFVKQTSSVNGLKYMLSSVIQPQLLTTNGFLLVQSTPPPVLTHDYTDVHDKQLLKGRVSTFTIEDNASIDADTFSQLKKSSYDLDPTGSAWRREYYAEFAKDERMLIVPNWSDEHVVPAWERPEHFSTFQRLVSYDHGTADLSVFLFGWYDQPNGVLVIESSLKIDNFNEKKSTQEISNEYKQHRQSLWGSLGLMKEICDAINPQVIIDFNRMFGHRFVPPYKSNREAMVNQLINLVQAGRIKIVDNDANQLLIRTLEVGAWNSTAANRDFARQAGIGHCDAIAALIYMVRGLNMTHNPSIVAPPPVGPNQLDFRPPAKSAGNILSKAIAGARRR